MSLSQKRKVEVVPPLTSRNAMQLNTLASVRAEMSRLYRLALNGRIPPDDLTKLVFTLKEIRCCLESEILTDVQRRLTLLTQNMDHRHGQRILPQQTVSSS